MQIEIVMDGTSVVKAEINAPQIATLLTSALRSLGSTAQSSPLTPEQAEDLLRRVHPKSGTFLRKIAENNGSITWPEICAIFGYTGTKWAEFSGSANRGINLAMGSATGRPGCKLVTWDDDDPAWNLETGWVNARVYIDGEALRSLRVTCGLASA